MRYSAAEKLEIIQLVGQPNLPQRRCLTSLGIPRQTFYRWYDNSSATRAKSGEIGPCRNRNRRPSGALGASWITPRHGIAALQGQLKPPCMADPTTRTLALRPGS